MAFDPMLGFAVLGFVIFLLCAIGGTIGWHAIRRADEALRGVFGGPGVRLRWGLGGREVEFSYRGAQARWLEAAAGVSGHLGPEPTFALGDLGMSMIEVQLPAGAPGRVVVTRDIFLPEFQKRNLADVKLGDSEFDDLFLVEEERPGLAARLVNREVRESLLRLRKETMRDATTPTGCAALTIGGRSIILKIQAARSTTTIARMREVVIAVADALASANGGEGWLEAAEFPSRPPAGGNPPAAVLGSGAICLICGGRLDEAERVECRACRTPHHRECFEYLGHCAVYACRCAKTAR